VKKVDLFTQYLPAEAAPLFAKWIDYFQCEFKISMTRSTKLGDYRQLYQGRGHWISVKFNLDHYAFLFPDEKKQRSRLGSDVG